MLTCTVSMVETSIAIIATCLPALRTMIIGSNTSKGASNTYGKHYELSSARRKANENRLTSGNVSGGIHSHGTRHQNGSEDSLFSDGPDAHNEAEHIPGKITVNTQIRTEVEETRSNSDSSKTKSPF